MHALQDIVVRLAMRCYNISTGYTFELIGLQGRIMFFYSQCHVLTYELRLAICHLSSKCPLPASPGRMSTQLPRAKTASGQKQTWTLCDSGLVGNRTFEDKERVLTFPIRAVTRAVDPGWTRCPGSLLLLLCKVVSV